MRITSLVVASTMLVGALVVRAAPEQQRLVVCSPGSPGSTEEAQPRMDTFAKALSAKSGTAITAVYDPSDAGGAQRIEQAAIAIVSFPFFFEHRSQLDLHARLLLVQKGRPALEPWALVAQKGRIKNVDALAGFTIASSAAFAPTFVRDAALRDFGKLPADVKLVQSSAVLSSLRRAAKGEQVAVLLDGTQLAAFTSLPFASQLEVVTRSPPMPAGVVVTVDSRMPAKTWSAIQAAMLGLGADALKAIEVDRFAPVDDKALAIIRKGSEP